MILSFFEWNISPSPTLLLVDGFWAGLWPDVAWLIAFVVLILCAAHLDGAGYRAEQERKRRDHKQQK